jgi:hypothetical protein
MLTKPTYRPRLLFNRERSAFFISHRIQLAVAALKANSDGVSGFHEVRCSCCKVAWSGWQDTAPRRAHAGREPVRPGQ